MNCPVCGTVLHVKETYSLLDIFNRWESFHKFSNDIIQSHLKQSSETNLYLCPKCSFGIFFPQVIGSEDFYKELDPLYQDDKWDFHEALKDIKGCKSIIDIGCGPGMFLGLAKPFVERVYGTEYNKAALIAAKNKGFTVFSLEDDLKKLEGTLDRVFCFHVLEHVPDPIEFIKKISLLLNDHGKLCISVPNYDGPVKYLGDNVMTLPPHHLTRWGFSAFQFLASKLNYRIYRKAYEPLYLFNQDYYSFYWVNQLFSGNSKMINKFRYFLTVLITSFFKLLKIFKFQRFNLLRGQAIYVVLEKNVHNR